MLYSSVSGLGARALLVYVCIAKIPKPSIMHYASRVTRKSCRKTSTPITLPMSMERGAITLL